MGIALYLFHALASALVVKRFGALTKALCVPMVLGGCYAYAVVTNSASMSLSAVASWLISSVLICLFVASKDATKMDRLSTSLPAFVPLRQSAKARCGTW